MTTNDIPKSKNRKFYASTRSIMTGMLKTKTKLFLIPSKCCIMSLTKKIKHSGLETLKRIFYKTALFI